MKLQHVDMLIAIQYLEESTINLKNYLVKIRDKKCKH